MAEKIIKINTNTNTNTKGNVVDINNQLQARKEELDIKVRNRATKVGILAATVATVAALGVMVHDGGDPSSPTFQQELSQDIKAKAGESRPESLDALFDTISAENNGLILTKGTQLQPVSAALAGTETDDVAFTIESDQMVIQPVSIVGGYLVPKPGVTDYLTDSGQVNPDAFGYIPEAYAHTTPIDGLTPVSPTDTVDMIGGKIKVWPENIEVSQIQSMSIGDTNDNVGA